MYPDDFPALAAEGFAITSPEDEGYNCIAWAAGDTKRWWWPTAPDFWPPSAKPDETVASFIAAFSTVGYAPCADGLYEPGYEKVALYADGNGVQHAARQIASNLWTSKIGSDSDITHTLVGLEGPCYGKVCQFLRRPVASSKF